MFAFIRALSLSSSFVKIRDWSFGSIEPIYFSGFPSSHFVNVSSWISANIWYKSGFWSFLFVPQYIVLFDPICKRVEKSCRKLSKDFRNRADGIPSNKLLWKSLQNKPEIGACKMPNTMAFYHVYMIEPRRNCAMIQVVWVAQKHKSGKFYRWSIFVICRKSSGNRNGPNYNWSKMSWITTLQETFHSNGFLCHKIQLMNAFNVVWKDSGLYGRYYEMPQ